MFSGVSVRLVGRSVFSGVSVTSCGKHGSNDRNGSGSVESMYEDGVFVSDWSPLGLCAFSVLCLLVLFLLSLLPPATSHHR